MPIETHHLRSSGVGRIVMFYTKSPRILSDIKDLASKLIDKWMRPILRRSANYKDTSQFEVQLSARKFGNESSIL
jgi:transcription factor SPN1